MELSTLVSLFTLVACAVLLWYVQQPGKTQWVSLYEATVTVILFVMYGGLLATLFARIVYLEARERSGILVAKVPQLRPLFEKLAAAERWLHFNLTTRELHNQGEMWGFLRAVPIEPNEAECE